MIRCPACGAPKPPREGVCAHHIATALDWATVNRVANDFFMRGIEPPAGSPDLFDELMAATEG